MAIGGTEVLVGCGEGIGVERRFVGVGELQEESKNNNTKKDEICFTNSNYKMKYKVRK